MKVLEKSAAKVSGSTGQRYMFVVETHKADGSDFKKVTVSVVALNKAQAWCVMGEACQLFMNDPRGRVVNSVTILR